MQPTVKDIKYRDREVTNASDVADAFNSHFTLQQFRVIRDHLNSKCLTSIIVFDI